MVTDETPTLVFDVGARFGPHPSFSEYKAPIRYVLIEADPTEADKLTSDFKTPIIDVVNAAIVPQASNSRLRLQLTKNAAMSSLFMRSDVSPLYRQGAEREFQPEAVAEIDVPTTTIDELSRRFGQPHFIKLDTEGGEHGILVASHSVRDAIGVRSEVTFTEVFSDGTGAAGSFSALHNLLVSYGFTLLNIDYVGQGDYFSKFASAAGRYGQLQSTDGVWIKPIGPLLSETSSVADGLRGIAFVLHNGAADLALSLLSEPDLCSRAEVVAPKLWGHLAASVAKHLYRLKWEPSQSITEHQDCWEAIFKRSFPEAHLYNSNPELNPSVKQWNDRLE